MNVHASDINTSISAQESTVFQTSVAMHFVFSAALISCLCITHFAEILSLTSAAQTPQLIAPRMVTPGSAVQQTTPGKLSALQIPVTLTINSPSNIQSITSSAPGVTTLNVTPSNVLPAAAPGDSSCSLSYTFYIVHQFLGHLPVCFIFCLLW